MTEIPNVLIAFAPTTDDRTILAEVLGGRADIVYLHDLDEDGRLAAVRRAEIYVGFNFRRELGDAAVGHLDRLRFAQMVTAGADQLAFSTLPPGLPVANNAGAWAEPMAEHALALALAAAKRLFVEHEEMRQGRFNQFQSVNTELAGGVCAIIGYGGIGQATARLMRCMDMRIQAINRSGRIDRNATDQDVDFIGTLDDLQRVLRAADVVVLSLARTSRTHGLLGARELSWMKENAILVNIARGELVDEAALFAHLKAHPRFFACIDSWWVEPGRHGSFHINHPFLGLPNVIGSPHNSANVPGAYAKATRSAAENVRRYLDGQTPRNVLREDERLG